MNLNIEFKYTDFPYRGGLLRDELIKLRGHRCENCGLEFWREKLIPLEAHHKDGNKCNNVLNKYSRHLFPKLSYKDFLE